MIVQLLMGLSIMLYMSFTAYSMYMRIIGKKPVGEIKNIVSDIVWWHGTAWVIAMPLIAVMTLSIIFANFIMNALSIEILIG